ncbi:MAG: glutamate synthase-related protein [Candidatus Micrarchaeota archaeon]
MEDDSSLSKGTAGGARVVMRAYLPKTPPKSKDTGGRKYWTAPIIDRMQRMGLTGKPEFDPQELTGFRPRFDSSPYPVSDMLFLDKDAVSSSMIADLSFGVGSRIFSAPIIPGEMSWGATQKEVAAALGEAAAAVNIIYGIGEGGVAPPLAGNQNLMVQVATGLFGIDIRMLRNAAIISVKMSQSAKVGIGGHLPGNKVDAEIANARGMKEGVDVLSDASRVFSIEEMRALVQALKHAAGKPVFIKAGASHSIEHVAAGAARAGADGIIIDGRGGGTGAAPAIHRDHIGMPAELAVRLAHNAITGIGMRDDFLIIAGGRVDLPSKAFKLMLLGADGVLLGTGALIALGCKVVNMCHKDCPTALTAIPKLADGSRKRLLEHEWAVRSFTNFFRAYSMELAQIMGSCGFHSPREARGRADILHSHGLPQKLSGMLGIRSAVEIFPVPSGLPQAHLQSHLEELAKTGRPAISSMGRTTDLDAPYSNLDLLDHEGRTVVGPAYDSHRETIETTVRLPGKGNVASIPLVLEEGGPAESSALATEKNTLILCRQKPAESRRRIIPVSADEIERSLFQIRESSGVLMEKGEATSENIRKLKMHSPDTPVYVMIDASENVREESVALARAGVEGIIISGTLDMREQVPLDVAVSQAHDALSLAIQGGKILRRGCAILAKTQIRSSRDIYALACLGADSVVTDIGALIDKPTHGRQVKLLSGLAAELRVLMGASGLSMMSSILGNRNILRAEHYLPGHVAELLGVDYIGA